jgi:integrase/recombinase XerD
MGLRLGETLALQVSDIDGPRKHVPIRRGKGHKDRLVPLPDLTYRALRALWCKHRHPRWLFPNAVSSLERIRRATTHMDRGGTQAAMKAVVTQCGIKVNPLAAPQLCNLSARTGLKSSAYPGFTGARQSHHHRALHSTH